MSRSLGMDPRARADQMETTSLMRRGVGAQTAARMNTTQAGRKRSWTGSVNPMFNTLNTL